MTPPDENPLAGRTCADRISQYPSDCIQEKCSRFEVCTYDLIGAARAIDRIRKHPSYTRIREGRKWGE
jgi:hypothetical protein